MILYLYSGNLNDVSLTWPSSQPEQGLGQSCAEKRILKIAVYTSNIQNTQSMLDKFRPQITRWLLRCGRHVRCGAADCWLQDKNTVMLSLRKINSSTSTQSKNIKNFEWRAASGCNVRMYSGWIAATRLPP
jgi:hypothetical protein